MIVQAVHFRQADNHAQGPTTRNDGGFVNGVAFRQGQAHNSMARFVIGRLFFLIGGQHHRTALGPHHHLVFGAFEIFHRHKTPAHTRSHQRGLVHQVGQIGARKARGAARDDAQINIGPKRGFARMHAQDFLAALDIGVGHSHLAVKAARAQQRRV